MKRLATTGSALLLLLISARWTLVGSPAIPLPLGAGPARLPLGLQICGAPGSDRALMDTAAWVESALAGRGQAAPLSNFMHDGGE